MPKQDVDKFNNYLAGHSAVKEALYSSMLTSITRVAKDAGCKLEDADIAALVMERYCKPPGSVRAAWHAARLENDEDEDENEGEDEGENV